jgi:hypothetical protein
MTHHPDWLAHVIRKTDEDETLRNFLLELHDPIFQRLHDLRKAGVDPAKSEDLEISDLHKRHQKILRREGGRVITNLSFILELYKKNSDLACAIVDWLFANNRQQVTNLEKFCADKFPKLAISDGFRCYLLNKGKYLRQDAIRAEGEQRFREQSIDAPDSYNQTLLDRDLSNADIEVISCQNNSLDVLGNQEFINNLRQGIFNLDRFQKILDKLEYKPNWNHKMFERTATEMMLNERDNEGNIFAKIAWEFGENWTSDKIRYAWKYGRSGKKSMEWILHQLGLEIAREHGYTADETIASPLQKTKTKKPQGEGNFEGDRLCQEGVA